MADDYDYFINRIDKAEGFGEKRKKPPKKKKPASNPEDEARNHFDDLAQTAERINKILEAKKSLNRFCIYRENGDIFFDLVILDESKNITKTIRKNITHQEFSDIIKNIEELDGFIVDYEA